MHFPYYLTTTETGIKKPLSPLSILSLTNEFFSWDFCSFLVYYIKHYVWLQEGFFRRLCQVLVGNFLLSCKTVSIACLIFCCCSFPKKYSRIQLTTSLPYMIKSAKAVSLHSQILYQQLF